MVQIWLKNFLKRLKIIDYRLQKKNDYIFMIGIIRIKILVFRFAENK